MVVTIYHPLVRLFLPTWQHHHLMIVSIIVSIIRWQLSLTARDQYGKANLRLDASLLQCTLRSQEQMLKPFLTHAPMRIKSPREWILPVALSLASILLTSLVLVEAHSELSALHVWGEPEHLALAYLLPTIFIAVFFGSTIAVMTSFASGLAAAYFISPPQFSVLIDDPEHVAELGFIIVLAITASKAVAVITDDKSVARPWFATQAGLA